MINDNISGPPPTHHIPLKPLYFEVPQPVPAPLIGRQWLWSEIRTHLESTLATNQGVIISGGPGAGKTALSLSLVERSCFGNRGDNEDLWRGKHDGIFITFSIQQINHKSSKYFDQSSKTTFLELTHAKFYHFYL